jgi:hypothetical protein
MDHEKESRLQRELLDGETIEWSGEPKPGAVFSSRDMLLIPFSICWCGVALFFVISSLFFKNYIVMAIFLLFLSFGLFMLLGRFIVLFYKNKNTLYAVTNRRILIICKHSALCFSFQDIPIIQIKEKSDGSGSLSFTDYDKSISRGSSYGCQGPAPMNRYDPIWPYLKFIFHELRYPLKEFRAIDHVNEVYRLICEKVDDAKRLG